MFMESNFNKRTSDFDSDKIFLDLLESINYYNNDEDRSRAKTYITPIEGKEAAQSINIQKTSTPIKSKFSKTRISAASTIVPINEDKLIDVKIDKESIDLSRKKTAFGSIDNLQSCCNYNKSTNSNSLVTQKINIVGKKNEEEINNKEKEMSSLKFFSISSGEKNKEHFFTQNELVNMNKQILPSDRRVSAECSNFRKGIHEIANNYLLENDDSQKKILEKTEESVEIPSFTDKQDHEENHLDDILTNEEANNRKNSNQDSKKIESKKSTENKEVNEKQSTGFDNIKDNMNEMKGKTKSHKLLPSGLIYPINQGGFYNHHSNSNTNQIYIQQSEINQGFLNPPYPLNKFPLSGSLNYNTFYNNNIQQGNVFNPYQTQVFNYGNIINTINKNQQPNFIQQPSNSNTSSYFQQMPINYVNGLPYFYPLRNPQTISSNLNNIITPNSLIDSQKKSLNNMQFLTNKNVTTNTNLEVNPPAIEENLSKIISNKKRVPQVKFKDAEEMEKSKIKSMKSLNLVKVTEFTNLNQPTENKCQVNNKIVNHYENPKYTSNSKGKSSRKNSSCHEILNYSMSQYKIDLKKEQSSESLHIKDVNDENDNMEKASMTFTENNIDYIQSIISNSNIGSFLCSHKGSKEFQKKISHFNHQLSDFLLISIIESNSIEKVMVDPYANYIFQRAIDCCSPETRIQIMKSIKKNFMVIASNVCGSHSLQCMVQLPKTQKETLHMQDLLVKYCNQIAMDQNAVHIMLKSLSSIREDDRKELNETILVESIKLVFDVFGVCVVSHSISII